MSHKPELNDGDAEGEYRPEFVERVLKAAQEPMVGRFTDPESFMAELSQEDQEMLASVELPNKIAKARREADQGKVFTLDEVLA